jgi:hypothetical protein
LYYYLIKIFMDNNISLRNDGYCREGIDTGNCEAAPADPEASYLAGSFREALLDVKIPTCEEAEIPYYGDECIDPTCEVAEIPYYGDECIDPTCEEAEIPYYGDEYIDPTCEDPEIPYFEEECTDPTDTDLIY